MCQPVKSLVKYAMRRFQSQHVPDPFNLVERIKTDEGETTRTEYLGIHTYTGADTHKATAAAPSSAGSAKYLGGYINVS